MRVERAWTFGKAALLVGVGLLALPEAADAGRQEADVCAKGLSSESRMIYGAAVDKVGPGVDNRELVRGLTQQLIVEGKVSRTTARPAAEAAGKCLVMLK
jgi:hypothetical protein